MSPFLSTSADQWKYHVFYNFRGSDVRYKFLSHLRGGCDRAKLSAFVDENLRRGEEISPAILTAIEESHVAVPIFSRDYASSPWCLEELVKIMECYDDKGLIVIPVFYDVSASDVLNQSGTYAEAFAGHERNWKNARKVPEWKAAMTKAANLSGRSARSARSEFHLVEEIVNDIRERLGRTTDGKAFIVETTSGVQRPWSIELSHTRTINVRGMGGLMMHKSEELPVEKLVSHLETLLSEISNADSSDRRAFLPGQLDDSGESKGAGQQSKNDYGNKPEGYIKRSQNVMPASSSSEGKSSLFLDSPEDKIVLYFTSMQANKKTYKDCDEVRMIFRNLQVAVDERNTYIEPSYRTQLQDALRRTTVSLPQVFIRGKHIGGLEEIRQLYEAGKLKQLVGGFLVKHRAAFCEPCGDSTFVLCPNCGPGRKCSYCIGGIIRCPACSS